MSKEIIMEWILKRENVIGWVAVGLITFITGFWAFWGIIENFHEGWHMETFGRNVLLMFVQYLSPMLIFMALSLTALKWPKVGGGLFVFLGLLFCIWIFSNLKIITFRSIMSWVPITVPLILIGVLFWFGRPEPIKRAYMTVTIVPLIVLIICGAEPVVRVAGRIDDGDLGMRTVVGNGVKLTWAPEGPGWPKNKGTSYDEAVKICRYLSEDGKTIEKTPQNIWRLPTIKEAVASQMRHGKNCQGQWNPKTQKTEYKTQPDKESPLWNTTSTVIYWWTSNEKDDEHAYIIVYNGAVHPRRKTKQGGSLGFRAVKKN